MAKLGIMGDTEIDFLEENGRIYIVRKSNAKNVNQFHPLRGIASVEMTTDEIMALTRG